MKKYLFSLTLLMFTGIAANAQFILGIKGGINIAKVNTNNLTQSGVAGYQAGLFARIGKAFFVQPEIYAGTKGSKFTYQNGAGTETGQSKFTTLDVPVLIGDSFGVSSFNIRFMAGPVYSYIIDRSDDLSTNFRNAYADFGNYNNSTLGYQAGVGLDLGNVTLDARYEGGLTAINQKYGERPNLFHLSLGFKIL